ALSKRPARDAYTKNHRPQAARRTGLFAPAPGVLEARRAARYFSSPTMKAMSARTIGVAALDPASLSQSLERLPQNIHACAHDGASVGFVLPFELDQARSFWRDKVGPSVAAAKRIVLIARLGESIVGTAQLDLDTMPNQRHRGEVSKVLVD